MNSSAIVGMCLSTAVGALAVAPVATALPSSCFQYVDYYQGGAYVVSKFKLIDSSGDVYSSVRTYGVGQSDHIDLSRYSLADMDVLSSSATVAGRLDSKLAGPVFSYCGNGLTINITSTGDLVNAELSRR